jgi:hypothetical protein
MTDVKETKEALAAIIHLALELKKLGADGYDLSDAASLGAKFVGDGVFRAKVVSGVQGAGAILEEIKDLSGAEAVELLGAAYVELKAAQ